MMPDKLFRSASSPDLETGSSASHFASSTEPGADPPSGSQRVLSHRGRLSRAGGWLFVRRGWLPWFALPLLIARSGYEARLGWKAFALGCVCLAIGEAFRIWAVGYAGTRTRTRSPDGKLKDLVTCGPYARVRNPIYVGNCFLAAGIVLVFGQWFLLPPFLLLAFLAYQPVVAWEEELLAHNFGEEYQRYTSAVPRWLPQPRRYRFASQHPFSWGQALFSERGTLGAMVSILLVAALKTALFAVSPQ